MNIIIEGPDATGKTTLVEKILAKHPDMTLLHDTGKTKNCIITYIFLDTIIRFYKINCISIILHSSF